tara:strand:+ start:359 stop:1327 length:969 start_codon:yes stop_codon:yes gene_type:complete
MAYSAGDKILDDEYNTFVNSSSSPFGYNHFAGTGALQYGLGESSISTVSVGDTINAAHWNSLFTAMTTVAGHTGDSLTSRSAVSAGDTIAIKAAVAADLATLAASVAAGCPNTSAVTESGDLEAPVSSSTWTGSFITEMTVTFANANKMRHFFNAGGKIRITPTRVGNGGASGASGKDGQWTSLYAAINQFDIKATTSARTGSGETQTSAATNTGFYDLGTGYTSLIKINDDNYPYTSNYVEISAKLNSAPGSATIITIKTESIDGASEFTYDSPNPTSADTQAYRNGQHKHTLRVFSTTTGGGLASAHDKSGDATASNSTS